MKTKLLLLIGILSLSLNAQIKTLSWNLENFGKSKSDATIAFIATTVKDYDIVALQEVVAGRGGAQAVARLADELNRKGAKWDYTISDPTSGSANKSERYAYLWQTARVTKVGKAWLEKKYSTEIDREPYLATFVYEGKQLTLVNFHAITKSKQPETEIKYFRYLPVEYPNLNLVFLGDFNCPQSHSVFGPLRNMGYQSVFKKQKTSLKRECKQEQCLASEFDNLWYHRMKVTIVKSMVLPFYTFFSDLKSARVISDHIPITAELQLH
ncbi:endonuclease/exonuclease/phosphatase family protein [Flavobacterium sp. XGLA_31]|uniref:endonuclease/exonuclease/phosphatase family protein n=1 Tax=Flavobacterium sp. XGLA_31 TaxID=3447666 RepID=UPI003F302E2E